VRYGDPLTFAAVAGAGSNGVTSDGTRLPWAFSGWSGGACAGQTSATCTIPTVTASARVSATFTPYNVMFVSSDNKIAPGHLGAFDPLAGNDGFRGADAHCQALADASSLPALHGKTYRAFLGDGTSPLVDALQRLSIGVAQAPRGWVRPDGRPFSDIIGKAGVSQSFAFPFVDENGTSISDAFVVATGANGDGTPEPGNGACAGWSSLSAPPASGGDAGNGDHLFTRSTLNISCGASASRIYCFGVDYAAPLTLPTPVVPFKRAFASSTPWSPRDGGNITDADGVCKLDAVNFGLCTSVASCGFLAVLAPNGATAQSRFANLTLPLYRTYDHVRVAASTSNFFAGILDAPLSSRLDGTYGNGYFHWTGGIGTGSAVSTCSGWSTHATGTGTMTQVSDVQMHPPSTVSAHFFDSLGTEPCSRSGYLMCME
jgi:hypothetical protein